MASSSSVNNSKFSNAGKLARMDTVRSTPEDNTSTSGLQPPAVSSRLREEFYPGTPAENFSPRARNVGNEGSLPRLRTASSVELTEIKGGARLVSTGSGASSAPQHERSTLSPGFHVAYAGGPDVDFSTKREYVSVVLGDGYTRALVAGNVCDAIVEQYERYGNDPLLITHVVDAIMGRAPSPGCAGVNVEVVTAVLLKP